MTAAQEQNMIALEPCPFCKGDELHRADTGVYWISCNSCAAEGPVTDTEDSAAIAWNRRAAPPAPAPAQVAVKALEPTEKQLKDATTEYLSHRGEHPYRILRGGCELWETHLPAMRAAFRAALALAEGQATPEGMHAWHAHDLIPGRAYESQNWGTVKYAGLDTYHGETTHEFRGSMPCGGARYIKSEKLGEFLKPKLAALAPRVQS